MNAKKIIYFVIIFVLYICLLLMFVDDYFYYFSVFLFLSFILSFLYFPVYYFFEKIKLFIHKQKIIKKYHIDYNYYREILDKYSPAVLNYILKGRVQRHKSLELTLLYLADKGYIDIEGMNLSDNEQNLGLEENVYYALSNYEEISKNSIFTTIEEPRFLNNEEDGDTYSGKIQKNWKHLIIDDAQTLGLVEKRPFDFSIIGNLISILLLFNSFLCYFFVIEDVYRISLGSFLMAFVVFAFRYVVLFYNGYRKTPLGCEVYAKLKALKRFIKDFSILDKRNVKELSFWNEYMIYAIMFNKFSILNKQSKDLYIKLVSTYVKSFNYSIISLISSFILIILSIFKIFYFIPIFIINLYFAVMDLETIRRKQAIFGMILSMFGFVFSILIFI